MAILQTVQDEDNVGQFLKLIHSLVGHTAAIQAHVNELDTELHTFHF